MERKLRLAKREDFNKVYRFGKSAANHQFVLYFYPQPEHELFRLGISASKKVGIAVVRNQIRRRIKEIVRLNAARIPPGYDYIVIVRRPAVDMEYKELEKSLFHVFRKAGLIGKK